MPHTPTSTESLARDESAGGGTRRLARRVSPWALVSCVFYLTVAFTFGEVFPFSTFSMYSEIGSRIPAREHKTRKGEETQTLGPRAAIITARIEGSYLRPESLHRFTGVDPRALIPPRGWSSSMQYRVDEVRHWVHTNRAGPGVEPGPVEVELGFILIESTPTGLTPGQWHPVTRGRAWSAP